MASKSFPHTFKIKNQQSRKQNSRAKLRMILQVHSQFHNSLGQTIVAIFEGYQDMGVTFE